MAELTFKKHPLSEGERKWLEMANTPQFDPKIARVKLRDILPREFDPKGIDRRLYIEGKLLPIGRWLLNPNDPIFGTADKVARAVRDLIIEKPGVEQTTAAEIAGRLNISEQSVGEAFYLLGELGGFYSSAHSPVEQRAHSTIGLQTEQVYDQYLHFDGIENALEHYYVSRAHTASLTYDQALFGQSGALLQQSFRPNTAFILMAIDPSKPELEDAYMAIKETCAEFGISAERADKIEHQGRITDRILHEIATCQFLIADLSYERPNVYYEVGYAHALNKNPILYRRKGTALHFDLSVHNAPEYKNATELRELVRNRLKAILGRDPKAPAQ